MVMSAYPFPLIATRDGVVAPRVAVVGTGGTLTISREDVHAQSVLNRDNELRWTKVKTKGWGWNHIEPISRVWQPKRGQPSNVSRNTQPSDLVVEELDIVEINLKTDNLLGDISQRVYGGILTHLYGQMVKKCGGDGRRTFFPRHAQNALLEVLGGEEGGNVSSPETQPAL